MNISKDTATIMKGYAILGIVLHNYLHNIASFSPQNEKGFSVDNYAMYISHFNGQHSIPFLFCDAFSFIGWIGVVVFIFLSGYGIASKYPWDSKINSLEYVKYNWVKLFVLFLPAALYYLIVYCFFDVNGEFALGIVCLTTMLHNFVSNIVPINPGVYWYLGLTFQLYLFYLLFHINNKGQRLMIMLGGISLVCQALMLLNQSNQLLGWFRNNSFGWLPVFAVGVVCASKDFDIMIFNSRWFRFICIILCIPLMVVMNANEYIWLFLPFVVVAFFYSLSIESQSCRLVKSIGLWLGKYSAFIFVAHPIARGIMYDHICPIAPKYTHLPIYLILTLLLAILYKPAVQKLK